ncbi:MAG: hypothetical protein CMD13_00165 [Flavobacteriales bacterium]|nr:hypothetical protein [Flavobacteriales bacterium]|tara:strand:- start:1695 stop:2792 length:1098 start_codon:yes stop_codon:yes gene_type:complete
MVAQGGFSRGHIDFANELKKHNIDSVFVIPEESGTKNIMRENNFHYHPLYVNFFPGLFSFSFEKAVKRNLKKIIEKEGPDIILFEPLVAEIILKIIKHEKFKLKTLMWDKSPPTDRTLLGRMQWKRWERTWKKIPGDIDRIMCQSKPHVDFVKVLTKKYDTNFIVMENGVDTDHFILQEGIQKNTKKMIYCGTISKVRGVMKLKKTGELLEKMGLDFEMHFLGRGAEYKKLKSFEGKYGWLHVHGFLEEQEFKRHLSEAAIGIIPHPYFECWEVCSSLKLREYASLSNVIVARDLEVHRDFKDYEWMYLAKKDDNDDLALAKAIKTALEDELIIEKGRVARKFAEEYFTYEKQTKKLLQWLLQYD